MTTERTERAKAALVPTASEDDRARARELVAVVRRGVETLEDDFYEVGVALRALRDGALHRAVERASGVPYTSLESLVRAEAGASASLVRKLLAIVECVPRDEASSLGADRAWALARSVTSSSNRRPKRV